MNSRLDPLTLEALPAASFSHAPGEVGQAAAPAPGEARPPHDQFTTSAYLELGNSIVQLRQSIPIELIQQQTLSPAAAWRDSRPVGRRTVGGSLSRWLAPRSLRW